MINSDQWHRYHLTAEKCSTWASEWELLVLRSGFSIWLTQSTSCCVQGSVSDWLRASRGAFRGPYLTDREPLMMRSGVSKTEFFSVFWSVWDTLWVETQTCASRCDEADFWNGIWFVWCIQGSEACCGLLGYSKLRTKEKLIQVFTQNVKKWESLIGWIKLL